MFAEDRARRHHVRAQRAKLSAAALAAREAMALQLLEARNAAVKARRHPSVANNPAAADAAAVAAAIGAATGSLRCAFGAPANNHVLRVLSSFLFLFFAAGVLGPDSAERVERLHLRGALGNSNRRKRSDVSFQSAYVG